MLNTSLNRNNNFDFLRLLFALLIVISHCYPLSGIDYSRQWIYQITNGQLSYSSIGLNGFFVISGFFIFRSMENSASIPKYLKKRFLRIFPGLFFMLCFTLFSIQFVYQSQIPYFTNKEVLSYLPRNISLYYLQPVIQGVFSENPYKSINGSLWTLSYEFSFYLLLIPCYVFMKNKRHLPKLFFVVFSLLILVNFLFPYRFDELTLLGMKGNHIVNFSSFFISGCLLASINFDRIIIIRKEVVYLLLTLTCLLCVLSILWDCYQYVKHIVFPIIVVIIGFMPIKILADIRKIGDLSYGVYIYSFPITQFLVYFYDLYIYDLMIVSSIISILVGYVSWHLIEKRVLRLKESPLIDHIFK